MSRDSSPGTTYEQVAAGIKINTNLRQIQADCEGVVDEYTDRYAIIFSVLADYYDTMDQKMAPKFKNEVRRIVLNRAIREIEIILRTFANEPGKTLGQFLGLASVNLNFKDCNKIVFILFMLTIIGNLRRLYGYLL